MFASAVVSAALICETPLPENESHDVALVLS
jgi:hypothetical protein